LSVSFNVRQLRKIPSWFFQNKALSKMKNFDAFIFKNLFFVLDNPGGACRFNNTKHMSEFQGDCKKA